jgi:hypothetical protein
LKTRTPIRLIFAAGLGLFIFAACGAAGSQIPTPARVLFIGNSYTSYNGGLDSLLKKMAPGSTTARVTMNGYSLQNHWEDGAALQAIREGGWNFVVLQEQSQTPIIDRTGFFDYARDFDQAIRLSGAATVLLMTWARPDSLAAGVTTNNLAAAYQTVGAELDVKVAPAGLAFGRSLQERPDLVLYGPDGHPTQDGTYLAACVLYTVLFDQSPLGNPYTAAGVPAETRTYFQGIAAETALR